jgi:hypothetical protein
LSIFARVSDEDEDVNAHLLPPPFDEDTYVGPIIVLATENEDQDDYDRAISAYVNLKADEYETLYTEWSFVGEEEEEEDAPVVLGDEDADIEIDMEDDEERFDQRVEDSVKGMMYWDSDPETGGENEEFIGYHDSLQYDVDMNGYKLEDFYPKK